MQVGALAADHDDVNEMTGFDNRAGFAFGDVVLGHYLRPCEQAPVHRPGVVVSSTRYNQQRQEILIMAIATEHRPGTGHGEIAIQHVRPAGLDQGASLMPVLATIQQKRIRLILGHLDDGDLRNLRSLLGLIFGA